MHDKCLWCYWYSLGDENCCLDFPSSSVCGSVFQIIDVPFYEIIVLYNPELKRFLRRVDNHYEWSEVEVGEEKKN